MTNIILTPLIFALRNEDGIVKRSTLLEAADAIENLQSENEFLRNMQKLLTANMSEYEIGIMVDEALKNSD